jgi:hypothetical protein
MLTNTNIIITPQLPANANFVNSWPMDNGQIWTVVVGVFAVVGFVYSILKLREWLDDRIARSVTSKESIERVSLLVKPDMLFDERESVLADRGAAAVVKPGGIHVTIGAPFPGRKLPVEIRVEFSKHLPVAPLLTPLNADIVTITTKTGKNFDWIYILHYSMAGDYDDGYTHKYRLEVF